MGVTKSFDNFIYFVLPVENRAFSDIITLYVAIYFIFFLSIVYETGCFQLTRICDSQNKKMYLLFSEGIDTYPHSLGNDSLILRYVYLIIRHHA